MKHKFSTWYGNQIFKQLVEGVNVDAVDVKHCLTTLKPLHAQRVVDFYDKMTTVKGKYITESGWGATRITNAISLGNKNIPAIYSFHGINPLLNRRTEES